MDFSAIAGSNVLITGGMGFIGSNLARRCVELDCNVTIITRSYEKKENIAAILDQIKVCEVDLSIVDSSREKIRELLVQKDFVYHLAAQTSHLDSMENPLGDLEANCAVTLELLEGCRELCPGVNFVMPGTVTQIGCATNLPVSEDHHDWPITLYDTHKLVCEKYLYVYHHNYGMNTTMLRLANIFGERQEVNNPKRGILNYMLWRALTGEDLTIYEPGDFIRDYSYIENCIDALLLAGISTETNGKSYVFGSGNGLEFQEMVSEIVRLVYLLSGKQSTVIRVPFPYTEQRMDVGDFVANNQNLCNDTGWYPRISFEDGLSKTITYYTDKLGEDINER